MTIKEYEECLERREYPLKAMSLGDSVPMDIDEVHLMQTKFAAFNDCNEELLARYKRDGYYHMTRDEMLVQMQVCSEYLELLLGRIYDFRTLINE